MSPLLILFAFIATVFSTVVCFSSPGAIGDRTCVGIGKVGRCVSPSTATSSWGQHKYSVTSLYHNAGDESKSTENTNVPLPPTQEDMEQLAFILANITDCIDTAPDAALSIASQNMGWLYARDVPKLTQQLLSEFPTLRQDKAMMRAYMFLLDFLEAVSNETASRLKLNQNYLRKLLEAAKLSEERLNEYIAENREKLISPDFTIYLDTEIEAQTTNSAQENLLVTIKLRLLDEYGKTLGVDVMLLPKLAAEEDPAELRRKTVIHLQGYDRMGQELFLQTLRIMMGEMRKRYQQVDPILFMNLREVEKITESFLEDSSSKS